MSFFSNIVNRITGNNLDVAQPETYNQLFFSYAAAFDVRPAISYSMLAAILEWDREYRLMPTQLMKIICKEASKLALTDYKIELIDTSGPEDEIKLVEDSVHRLVSQLPQFLECGIALGGLMFKPSQYGISIISPLNFVPISYNSAGDITAAIFVEYSRKGEMNYTKLEYHHWLGTDYCVDTKVYKSRNPFELGFNISPIEVPEWAHIDTQVTISNLKSPLFKYFRMPGANSVEPRSPLGISIAAAAFEYLKSFQNTYEGFKMDMETTRKVIFVSNTALLAGERKPKGIPEGPAIFTRNPIPNLIVGVNSGPNGVEQQIKEFNPSCNVKDFKVALQLILNMVALSCGFSAGFLLFDNRHIQTATQVESEDQQTVSTIMSIRDALNTAVEGAVKSLVDFLALYSHSSVQFKLNFYARDLTATPYADRERVVQLVRDGLYPLEKYLRDYEGLKDNEIAEFKAELAGREESAAEGSKRLLGSGTQSPAAAENSAPEK